MAGNLLRNKAASAAWSITIASLASDTNLRAGRQSASLDVTVVNPTDILIGGKVTTGTSPTAGQIEVHAVGQMDGDTTWPDAFSTADANRTINDANVKAAYCKPVAIIATNNTSNVTSWFGPVGIAQLFGSLPDALVMFVVHSTVAALNATGGNHALYQKQVYGQYT